jgi:hypothetical protein
VRVNSIDFIDVGALMGQAVATAPPDDVVDGRPFVASLRIRFDRGDTVRWPMHPMLARSVSQRDEVTLKRWRGFARYRQRYERRRRQSR